MLKTILTTLTLLLFVAASSLAEEKRWVASEGATLKQDASVSSPDLAPLPVGTELALIESGGRWLKVKTSNGKEGWVYAGKVADAPPAAEVTADGGLFGETLQGSQIKTAKADSARSIRGLSPETAQYAKQRGTPEIYKKELDKVLARKVSAKELRAFLKDGTIGEFAP